VSTWLQGTRDKDRTLPIAELVEHIPYKETRDYVKKVTEGYSAYVSLYAPSGSALGVPPEANGDRKDVVDF
jgi:soluble lytic murein transglycosylase-like protein